MDPGPPRQASAALGHTDGYRIPGGTPATPAFTATLPAFPANLRKQLNGSPVERMDPVEIIRGDQTSDETLARAVDYVRAIGKYPIVVRDGRGFFTTRVFSTYLTESIRMLAEGNDPAVIEQAGNQAGNPRHRCGWPTNSASAQSARSSTRPSKWWATTPSENPPPSPPP